MNDAPEVTIHPSQFPGAVHSDLVKSLRDRALNHKFLYDGYKQSRKWLALHQAYSPSQTDPDCARIYEEAFDAASQKIAPSRVHVVGLGCGGGVKDGRLLERLVKSGKEACYSPVDVSLALVLSAREQALRACPAGQCFPIVCDLGSTEDLGSLLTRAETPETVRLITFFGMIPNFEPAAILGKLATLTRPGDLLLFSANLAPGQDYHRGVEQVLPLYNNELTRDWLMSFLRDLGIEESDGELRIGIEEDSPSGLKRITARFYFRRSREAQIEEERVRFEAGEDLRVFFSYRHTPSKVTQLLGQHGVRVLGQWITTSEEEGVFLAATNENRGSDRGLP